MQAAKLHEQAIIDQYGRDFPKRLPRGIKGKQGIAPDTAAHLYGFPTGQELLLALANARPRKALIEAETDQRMRDEYGDMRFDGTMAEEALAAVMNQEQEKVIASELAALNRKRREVAPFVRAEQKAQQQDRKSTRLNSSHIQKSRMPSSA